MSTIKISNLTSSGAIIGNVLVPVVGNVAGTLTTLKSTVDQLKTFIVASAEANILAANAATIWANLSLKSYVDGQITAANAGVTAANIGMKGYVDSVASQSIYGNANVASYLTVEGYAKTSDITTANTSMKSYVDGQITAANAGVTTANIGMKGYVDNQTFSNVQVATYLPTYNGNVTSLTVSGTLVSIGNVFVANTYVPSLANSPGTAGQIVWDSSYVYICIGTDTWKRANISTW